MKPEIQREYDRTVTALVVERGDIIGGNGFGWQDFDALRHIGRLGLYPGQTACTLIVPEGAQPREDEWTQYEGTYGGNDTPHHGITVQGVSCACGQLTGRAVRWEAGLSEIAEAVFGGAFGARP